MAELKTQKNAASVEAFLQQIADERQRRDCLTIMELMREITGHEPSMWGTAIVGFGSYHYTYASGREGDWMVTGFAPRKQSLTLYIMPGFSKYDALMKKLGKHKTGKSCLYIKRLEDVDLAILKSLIGESVKQMAKTYPK